MYFPYPLQSELACIVCLKNFYIPSKHTAPVELTGSGEPLSSIEKHFCGGSVLHSYLGMFKHYYLSCLYCLAGLKVNLPD